MREYLFQEPISDFIAQKLGEARTHAEALTAEQLQDPGLAGALEKIADFRFELASLISENRKGKRKIEKQVRMDYGQEIGVDVDFIDITIPFVGWPKSFHLAPSHSNIIDTRATTGKNGIEVSFLDDHNLDQNVDNFIRLVKENLNNLRNDLQKIKPQMLQMAQSVANQRLEQIKARKERDKGRSFPIE